MTPSPLLLDRHRVLAHRLRAHGLLERVADLPDVAVLGLGVQDTPPGALRTALSARLTTPLEPDADLTAGGALTIVWSHRGAPHLHPTAGLAGLAAATWPVSDADAAARLGWQRARLAEVGGASRRAIRTVAGAVAEVLADSPGMSKAELSGSVTSRVPPELSPWCAPCDVHHVGEQLLRLAGLGGGLRLRAGARPLLVEPVPGWAGPPADGAADPSPVIEEYLRLFAPATPGDVAGFLGTSVAVVRPHLPADLVRVEVDGRSALCPPAQVEALTGADPAAGDIRLLGPSDPYLQGRDREVLVPDKARRSAVWRSIGQPGVVLVGGEVVGTWRTRQQGRRLEITVEPFRTLHPAERSALDADAERVRTTRGAGSVRMQVG
ncbi:MAG: winged helix DNA-binding domain-containing protein [Pseudonocardia sp.]|nr:winged helix DNA-binding domain-containing protein [Pseudonocardia sp.]